MSDTDSKETVKPEGDATEKEPAAGVHTTITREGPCVCVIKVQAEADHLKKRYDEELATLVKEASLPGFRRGKAPKRLVETKFGERIRSEALSAVITEAYDEAVKNNDLAVAAQVEAPDFEQIKWQVGEPVEVQFRCEVLPNVDVQPEQYKGIEACVPLIEVTDEALKDETERFRRQLASWEKTDGAAIDREDYVEAMVAVLDADGTEIQKTKIGFNPKDEQIGIFKVQGLAGALAGGKVGQSFELEGKLPDHVEQLPKPFKERPELAGKTLKLQAQVQNVYRQRIPDIDDELAKKLGMKDAAEVKEYVRTRLLRRLENERAQAAEYAVLDAVLQRVPFELPPSLVERATREQERRLLMRALRLGMTVQQAEQIVKDNADGARESAIRGLKTAYILRKIADKERIFVTDDEVQEQVRALAARQNWSERKTQRYMEEHDLMSSLRADMRENRTIQFLLQNAKLTELPAAEYRASIEAAAARAKTEAEMNKKDEKAEPEKTKPANDA
jgi:trigger factor